MEEGGRPPGGRGNEKPPGVPAVLKYAGTTGGSAGTNGGTCDGLAGNGGHGGPEGPAGEERERERLELENLGTSAGYGYLPVAQA